MLDSLGGRLAKPAGQRIEVTCVIRVISPTPSGRLLSRWLRLKGRWAATHGECDEVLNGIFYNLWTGCRLVIAMQIVKRSGAAGFTAPANRWIV